MPDPIRISVAYSIHQHMLRTPRGIFPRTVGACSAVVHCGMRNLAHGFGPDRIAAVRDAVANHRACRGTFPSVYASEASHGD